MDDQGTTLWRLTKDGRDIHCRARLLPHGVEIDILNDGALSATRAFDTGEQATAWAQQRREERERQGWLESPGSSGA